MLHFSSPRSNLPPSIQRLKPHIRATGKQVYRERLADAVRGSGSGRICYASPVLIGEKLYVVSRAGGTYVFDAAPKFRQVARNRFASDSSDFNATPAVSGGQLFLRSNRFLYCVASSTE